MFLLKCVKYPVTATATNTFDRTVSFKVLKSELNKIGDDFKDVKIKSTSTKKILDNLVNFVRSSRSPKEIYRHTVTNKKLLVRHRLKLLFDSDSPFLEIGLLAGMCMDYGTIPSAASTAVIGKISSQYCIVSANDATVKGGTFFPISIAKQLRVQQLAYLNHLPCVYLVDSGGAFLPLQADIFPDSNHGGRTFYNEAVLSSLGIPQIALVCGSCTAGGAYCPTMAEESIIVKGLGTIFLAGPPLVKAATGEEVTEQDLGGADIHCRKSGCCDYFAETEEEAFEMCRESVLASNLPEPGYFPFYKEPCYPTTDLFLLSGKSDLKKQDMYIILSRILDESRFKEFKEKFGRSLITGYGYVHGMLIGVLANSNPLTGQDCEKGCHFIQLCQKRAIPLVFLQNSGKCTDQNISIDVLRDRAKMMAAVSCATVPKIAINVGGCHADDNYTMCGFSFEPNFFFSWPWATVSSSRGQVPEKPDVWKELSESQVIEDYEILFEDSNSAFYGASRMLSDGIIYPEDTRQVIATCLEITRRNVSQQMKNNSLALFRM